MSSKRHRRVTVLNLLEKEDHSVADVSKEFVRGKTQNELLKRKANVLDELKNAAILEPRQKETKHNR